MTRGVEFLLAVLTLATVLLVSCSGQDTPVEQAEEEAGVEEVAQPELTPDDVVKAFEEEGLEVGEYYHVEEDPEWGTGMLPKTMDSGTRFELASYAPTPDTPRVGSVYHFASAEDQRVVSEYLTTVNETGGMFYSHVYETDGFLLQLDGGVPKQVADRYGSVLERVTE